MNAYMTVVACVLNAVFAISADQPDKDISKDKIQVQVTGLLSSGNTVFATDSPYAGAVLAGKRHFFLDCTHNKQANDLLRKEYADLAKYTSFIPSRHVHVTGRLQFVPYELYDEKGNKIEHRDTRAVIVVESVKVVK